jgi:carboxylesterase type B
LPDAEHLDRRKTESQPRPVLVWIYPGGFIGGSGSDPLFDGEGLARKGVVVVTFNYRLGVLGFLATPELSGESARESGTRRRAIMACSTTSPS